MDLRVICQLWHKNVSMPFVMVLLEIYETSESKITLIGNYVYQIS